MKKNKFNEAFRLFITAAPEKMFPLGLLQMSTKVTNEPPSGFRAGLMRSYTTMVDQDRLERIETPMWRQLLFSFCFLHSVVQERREIWTLGMVHPIRVQRGRSQRLHNVFRNSLVHVASHQLEHGAVHGGRNSIRGQDNG